MANSSDGGHFFAGTRRAYVPVEKIVAHNMQNNKEMAANVMNGAFKLYYDGHQAAASLDWVVRERHYSHTARHQIEDLKWAVQKDLRNTADCNLVVADLLTCFRHLEATNGYWHDTKLSGWNGIVNIPLGVANFLDAVAGKLKAINASAADWEASKRHMERLAADKKWGEFPSQLENTSKFIEHVVPMLWAGLGASGNNGQAYIQRMTQVFGWAGKVHTALDLGMKIKYSPNAQQTAFIEAMALVMKGLPVFGEVYGDVLRGVPEMVNYFQRIAIYRYRAVGL